MIPGSNLLADALGIIAPQPVELYRWTSKTRQPNGAFVSQYAGPEACEGSVQAIDRRRYLQMGLEWARTYVMLYTVVPLRNIERDISGDLFTYDGQWFEAQSRTNWMAQDGWNAITAVAIPAPVPSQITP